MLYLELIWIEDEHVAAANCIDILGRFIGSTQSISFGIGLRGKSGTAEFMAHSTPALEWMRPDMSIRFAAENLASVEEPIYSVILTHCSHNLA